MTWTTDDQRRYNASYYRANRAAEMDRVARRQRATLEFLRAIRCVPCADCGGSFAPYVMDFDHRDPSKKSFALAAGHALLKNRSVLISEIEKCDIVCANCHRMRTYAAVLAGTLPPPGFQRSPEPSRTPKLQRKREQWHKRCARDLAYLDLLRELPCADCGRRYSPCVMEFDHRDPSKKRYLISRMPGRVRFTTLLSEVAKCDIVCANCHRERTFRRRQNVGSQEDRRDVPESGLRGLDVAPRSSQLRLLEETPARYAA